MTTVNIGLTPAASGANPKPSLGRRPVGLGLSLDRGRTLGG